MRPEYKRTEVGIIPSDWELISFAELLDFRNGVNAAKSAYGRGIPFINVLEVLNYSHVRATDIPGRVWLPRDVIERFLVRRGDVIFNRTSETQEEVGLAAVYDDDAPVVFGGFVIRGRPKIATLNPIYSGYGLRAPIVRSQIVARGQGAIRANVGQADLRQILVPLPTVAEQSAIAEALHDIDALLCSLAQLVAKKRDLKQAAMQQLLTGRTRLPGFSATWEQTRLGEVADIISGGTPRTSQAAYWEGNINWCTPTDITATSGKYLWETERTISAAGLSSCSAQLLPAGALLLCTRATIGEVKIAAREVCTNQGFKSLVVQKGISNEFLYYLLLTKKPQMVQSAIGSTFLEMSRRDTASLPVNVPPLDEQQAIAAVLSDMDAEIAALEQRLAKTRALKQGMMQELLTGRIRLVPARTAT